MSLSLIQVIQYYSSVLSSSTLSLARPSLFCPGNNTLLCQHYLPTSFLLRKIFEPKSKLEFTVSYG